MTIRTEVLERHVRASNAIEGIRVEQRHPLHREHLAAARASLRGPLVHPNRIHRILLRTSDRAIAGRYRTCRLYIGGHELPSADRVPQLMDTWWQYVLAYWHGASSGPRAQWSELAWILHLHFLCIHPYVDGNGRTARIVLNMLRRRARIPWKVIEPSMAHSYYRAIRRYEERIFTSFLR